MPTLKWACDTCDEPYDTWDEAKECEDIHAGIADYPFEESTTATETPDKEQES